jgi:hypothetical protein
MKEEYAMSISSLASKSFAFVAIVWFSLGVPALAQFVSGSTGSDGALIFQAPNPGQTITVIFNPASFTPPLDPAHDNIFNFTTITIPAGVTVQLVTGTLASGPVVWLATGAVDIEGTLDLSGATGHPPTNPAIQTLRVPAAPGPGGYTGGVGGNGGTLATEPGLGPGGGAAGGFNGCGGGGAFTGNSFLVPLFGGSGGGGQGGAGFGGGGGGGGGAILIASSSSITVNGTISANGGTAGSQGGALNGGGSGAGGAIRLAAPLLRGNGQLSVRGGGNTCNGGGNNGGTGTVRLEAVQEEFTGGFSGATVTSGTPFNTFLPAAPPAITVVSVGGIPVNPLPTGSFQTPDVTINSTAPVTVAIRAANVPVGTVVTLEFYSENGPDIKTTSTPLAGNLASSTATAQVTFPSGFARGFIFASF